tara:strand:+ start:419 stop:1039 length:621 start_codon:yes stop_codon:yes gene_type:complete
MATIYQTSWHRFNTVGSFSGTSNTPALVGTGLGTASMPDPDDDFKLEDPTVIDDSGNTQTFSTEIANAGHAGYTIKGIQIQMHASSSIISPLPDIRYSINLPGGPQQLIVEVQPTSVYPYQLRTYPYSNTDFDMFNLTLNTTNVDDLELNVHYNSSIGTNGDWFVLSNTFNNNSPTPAIRIWYELIPKLTITTGKLNITSGKVSIV